MATIDQLLQQLDDPEPYERMKAFRMLVKETPLEQISDTERLRVSVALNRLKNDPEHAIRQYAVSALEQRGVAIGGNQLKIGARKEYSPALAFVANTLLPGLGALYLRVGLGVALGQFALAGLVVMGVNGLLSLAGFDLVQFGLGMLTVALGLTLAKSDPTAGLVWMALSTAGLYYVIFAPGYLLFGWWAKRKADELNGDGPQGVTPDISGWDLAE